MLSIFTRDVLGEIYALIESVSEGFPTCCSMALSPKLQCIITGNGKAFVVAVCFAC